MIDFFAMQVLLDRQVLIKLLLKVSHLYLEGQILVLPCKSLHYLVVKLLLKLPKISLKAELHLLFLLSNILDLLFLSIDLLIELALFCSRLFLVRPKRFFEVLDLKVEFIVDPAHLCLHALFALSELSLHVTKLLS